MENKTESKLLVFLISIYKDSTKWRDKQSLIHEFDVFKESLTSSFQKLVLDSIISRKRQSKEIGEIRDDMRSMIGEILLKRIEVVFKKCETRRKELEDPITKNMILDPVNLRETGTQYDKTTLMEYLKKSSTDPLNRKKKLKDRSFVCVTFLKTKIEEFVMEVTNDSVNLLVNEGIPHLEEVQSSNILIDGSFPISISKEDVLIKTEEDSIHLMFRIVGFLKHYHRKKVPLEILLIEERLCLLTNNIERLFDSRISIFKHSEMEGEEKYNFLKRKILDCFSTEVTRKYSYEVKRKLVLKMLNFHEKNSSDPVLIHEIICQYVIPLLGPSKRQSKKVEIFERFYKKFPESDLFLHSLFESLPNRKKRHKQKKSKIAHTIAQRMISELNNINKEEEVEILPCPSELWEGIEKYLSVASNILLPDDQLIESRFARLQDLMNFYENYEHPKLGLRREKIAELCLILSDTEIQLLNNNNNNDQKKKNSFSFLEESEKERKKDGIVIKYLERAYSLQPNLPNLRTKLKNKYIKTGNYKRLVLLTKQEEEETEGEDEERMLSKTENLLLDILEGLKSEFDQFKTFVMKQFEPSASSSPSYVPKLDKNQSSSPKYGDEESEENDEPFFLDDDEEDDIEEEEEEEEIVVVKPIAIETKKKMKKLKKKKRKKKKVVRMKKVNNQVDQKLMKEVENESKKYSNNLFRSMYVEVKDPSSSSSGSGGDNNKNKEETLEDDRIMQQPQNLPPPKEEEKEEEIPEKKKKKMKKKKVLGEEVFSDGTDEIGKIFFKTTRRQKEIEIERRLKEDRIERLRTKKRERDKEIQLEKKKQKEMEELKRLKDEKEKKERIRRQKDDDNYVSIFQLEEEEKERRRRKDTDDDDDVNNNNNETIEDQENELILQDILKEEEDITIPPQLSTTSKKRKNNDEQIFHFVVYNPEVRGEHHMISYSGIHKLLGKNWRLKVVSEICGKISIYMILMEPKIKKLTGSLYLYFNKKEKDSHRSGTSWRDESIQHYDPYSGGDSKKTYPGFTLRTKSSTVSSAAAFHCENDERRNNTYWVGMSEFECIGFDRCFDPPVVGGDDKWIVSGKIRIDEGKIVYFEDPVKNEVDLEVMREGLDFVKLLDPPKKRKKESNDVEFFLEDEVMEILLDARHEDKVLQFQNSDDSNEEEEEVEGEK